MEFKVLTLQKRLQICKTHEYCEDCPLEFSEDCVCISCNQLECVNCLAPVKFSDIPNAKQWIENLKEQFSGQD